MLREFEAKLLRRPDLQADHSEESHIKDEPFVGKGCVMAQKESQSERTEKFPLPNFNAAELAAVGKRQIDEFVKMQTELLDKLQEMNRQWLDRAKLNANLASELASKLTAARSIPDAMAVCQEWTSRRFEMMAEDGKHLLADTQKFMEVGAQLLSNGSLINGGKGLGT